VNVKFLNNKKVAIAIVVLIAVVIIFIAVKNTFQVARTYVKLNQQLNTVNNRVSIKNPQEEEVNRFLLEEVDMEGEVFASISQSCQQNHVNLKQVHVPKILNDGDVVIITQQVTLQGDFIQILRCLQDIQAKPTAIKISSLRFETEEINKIKILVAQVYFQGVKLLQENNE
jgi:hypothetical protein